MAFCNILEDLLLDKIFGNTNYKPPATYHFGLDRSEPDDVDFSNEVNGTNYSRASYTNSDANWDEGGDGTVSNANDITFPTAGGAWATTTHLVIASGATGANVHAWGTVSPNRTIYNGDTPVILANDLTIGIN